MRWSLSSTVLHYVTIAWGGPLYLCDFQIKYEYMISKIKIKKLSAQSLSDMAINFQLHEFLAWDAPSQGGLFLAQPLLLTENCRRNATSIYIWTNPLFSTSGLSYIQTTSSLCSKNQVFTVLRDSIVKTKTCAQLLSKTPCKCGSLSLIVTIAL